jgi:lipopolysaccharide transport system ATP-binding protein
MTIAITVEGLGKEYMIGHRAERYTALRDVIMRQASRQLGRVLHPFSRAAENPGDTLESFWALKNVSFTLHEGERLGVIGRNGAGKSTLLKVLSRITEPTEGRVSIRGRLGSLLEVGTGFHPELTGRENIYLNGAILGMRRAEISRQFDEIVEFAEIERFLDTPVKRYSSGMYVRLAFAVAAHLQPEILVVDEVLAVGDAQFQKKCLGRMEEVGRSGRTILFVSHNMAAITSLCDRCILLERGRMVFDGSPSDAILKYYSNDQSSPSSVDFSRVEPPIGDEYCRLVAGAIEDRDGKVAHEISLAEPAKIVMTYEILEPRGRMVPNFHFYNADGVCAFVVSPTDVDVADPGIYRAECVVPAHFLNEGAYFVGLAVTSYFDNGYQVNFFERGALSFNMRDPLDHSTGRLGYTGPIPGVIRPWLSWRIQRAG